MSVVLVTGANRGLGLEFVKQYAGNSWNVIACCRDPSKADELADLAKTNKTIHLETLDAGDMKSIIALAAKLQGAGIDVLINNAGIYSGAGGQISAETGDASQDFGSIDPEAWDKVLRINTISPIMVTQAFIPHLLAGKQRKVVNITSRMGSIHEMGDDSIAYRSSKAALNAAMRVIMHDLTKKEIAIVNLHPGWVKTDMGGKGATLTPATSITGMRKVIDNLTLKNTGGYVSYDGKRIEW